MTESHPRASAASSTGMRPGATSCAGRSGGFGRRSWEWDCAAESWWVHVRHAYALRVATVRVRSCAVRAVCRAVPWSVCAAVRLRQGHGRRACCGRATILHNIQVSRQSLIVGGGGLFVGRCGCHQKIHAPFTAMFHGAFTALTSGFRGFFRQRLSHPGRAAAWPRSATRAAWVLQTWCSPPIQHYWSSPVHPPITTKRVKDKEQNQSQKQMS